MRHLRPALLSAVLALAVTVPGVAAPADDAEIAVGRRGVAQIEARFKVVTDPAVVERLTRIGRTLAATAPRPHLPYTFKAVQLDEINAVALPGGFVYVTTGLLGFVRSDHELAAVMAHEVAHAALGHGMQLARQANRAMIVTVLIAVFTRDPSLAQGSVLFSTGLMAGYTRDMEREADLASIDYLTRTPFSPVGVLTVLERLRRREQLAPAPEPIFPDHPKTVERVRYVTEALQARRIPLNRRVPANYLVLTVREVERGAELLVNDRTIVRLADTARVRAAAEVLDRLFDTDLEPYEVVARETQDGWAIMARGFTILWVGPRDVGPAVREFVSGAAIRLRAAIDEDIRRRRLDG